ncbi:hypothetical protein [uncultured Jannaschia sp.]|uniref:hypothetical protein n=1 Tax=uncultured Jannaschia sp. TaxID=293347 RepID=UPI002612FBE5|nr:hypothetical protein [uncultured Jannaschia sp.]
MPDDDTPPQQPRHLHLVTRDAEEIREMLDLLGTLVASVSDRVEGQSDKLDKLTRTAAETRAAAFHAKAQMDLKPVADAIAKTLEKTITPLSRELVGLRRDIHADRKAIKADIDSLLQRTSAAIVARDRQIAGLQARSWIPFAAIGALVLVMATAILAPWALAKIDGGLLCWAADGTWFVSSGTCVGI